MMLNLIDEAYGYWRLVQRHKLSDTTVKLGWHLLMLSNTHRWTEIERTNAELMAELHMDSHKPLDAAKAQLGTLKIVNITRGKGKRPTKYLWLAQSQKSAVNGANETGGIGNNLSNTNLNKEKIKNKKERRQDGEYYDYDSITTDECGRPVDVRNQARLGDTEAGNG